MERSNDRPETLPPPELNPLVNPLLAQHMGKWAEVYFNSPPEKRDEAVQNLLRQLEGKTSQPENDPPHQNDWNRTGFQLVPTAHEVTSEAVTSQNERICGACGHVNPANHVYCGMCGGTFSSTPALASSEAATAMPGIREPEDIRLPESMTIDRAEESPEANHYFLSERPHSIEDDEDDHMMFESVGPSFSYGYRIFMGLVLASVIGALVYMTVRSGKSGTDVAQATPPAPAVADQPAPATSAANNSEAPKTESAPATKAAAPEKHAAGPSTGSALDSKGATPRPETEASPGPVASKNSRVREPLSPKPASFRKRESVRPAAGNGAEELAMAQKYLNGGVGERRDPAQAAQWLWKSIAKHNGQATVLLADLYLHGDGMQKNCEQARVLLDAAATKGVAGAGERLRHMQAFGCQ